MAGFAVFTWQFVRASAREKLELLEHEEDAALPSYASLGWLVGWLRLFVFGAVAVENARFDGWESALMALLFVGLIWIFVEINAAAWGLVFMSLGIGHVIGIAWARGSLLRYAQIWLASTVVFWGLLWLAVRRSNNSTTALMGYLIWVGVHLGVGALILGVWWVLRRHWARQVRTPQPVQPPQLPNLGTLDDHLTDGDWEM